MPSLTWRELRTILAVATEEQLDDDVTVEVDGEFYGGMSMMCGGHCALDETSLYLCHQPTDMTPAQALLKQWLEANNSGKPPPRGLIVDAFPGLDAQGVEYLLRKPNRIYERFQC